MSDFFFALHSSSISYIFYESRQFTVAWYSESSSMRDAFSAFEQVLAHSHTQPQITEGQGGGLANSRKSEGNRKEEKEI